MSCNSYPILNSRWNESNEPIVVGGKSTEVHQQHRVGKENTVIMAITESPEITNDLIDLTNERVDNLAALITVSAEQLEDRLRAGELLDAHAHRTDELISLVFGSDTPSVESYLQSHGQTLQAA